MENTAENYLIALDEMKSDLLLLVAAAVLFEPEEIQSVAEGKVTAAEVMALLPDRLPDGPNFSVSRLTRGLGIRTSAAEFKAFWENIVGSPSSDSGSGNGG